jgi:hypothetical protein
VTLRSAVLCALSGTIALAGCGEQREPPRWSVRVHAFEPKPPERRIDSIAGRPGFVLLVMEDGSIAGETEFVSPTSTPVKGWFTWHPSQEEDRFRRAVVGRDGTAYALTRRGQLHRMKRFESAEPYPKRVQPGSLLAAGVSGVWVAGEAGGLALLDPVASVLSDHWETGDPPTSALAVAHRVVAVGRVTGEVEGAMEGAVIRKRVFTFDAPVNALAIDETGAVAAADGRGRIRTSPPSPTRPADWDAGGPVVALVFPELVRPTDARSGPIALRADGAILCAPRGGEEPERLHGLATPVRSAIGFSDQGSVGFYVLTETGLLVVTCEPPKGR